MPVPVLDADLPSAISSPARHESFWVAGWRRLRRRKLAMASFVFIAAMIILSLLTPKIAPYPFDVPTSETFQQPSLRHWFGTDLHGRDVFTRVLYGGRLSLLVGFVATVVSLSIGVLYGAIAGYAGGKIDNAMMRLVDILYSLPHLVFVIVLISFLEDYLKRFLEHDWFGLTRAWIPDTRILLLLVGLGVLQWLTMARIVRGQVLSLREQQFVLASRALGARAPRIILRHLIPNVTGPVLVYLTLTIPAVMLREAFLSFLGLGIQPPRASWGSLVSEGAGLLNPVKSYWWLVVFPGTVMALTLLALNILGDGLRDALDPKTQR